MKKSFFKKFFSIYWDLIWAKTADWELFDHCLGPTIDFFEPNFFLCIFNSPMEWQSLKKNYRAIFEKLSL